MIISSVLYVAEFDGGIILFNKNVTLKQQQLLKANRLSFSKSSLIPSQISVLLLCLKSLLWD